MTEVLYWRGLCRPDEGSQAVAVRRGNATASGLSGTHWSEVQGVDGDRVGAVTVVLVVPDACEAARRNDVTTLAEEGEGSGPGRLAVDCSA